MRVCASTIGDLAIAGVTSLSYTSTQISVPLATNATTDAGTSGAICTTGGVSIHLDAYIGGTMNVTGLTKCLPSVNTV